MWQMLDFLFLLVQCSKLRLHHLKFQAKIDYTSEWLDKARQDHNEDCQDIHLMLT